MSELDDLVRNERFQEIHDARRQVIEDERAINEALADGRATDSDARRLFQRAVDAYVRELEYLLNPTGEDAETSDYWDSKQIGAMELPNGETRSVDGLGEYLDLPEVIEVTVREIEREHYYDLGTATARTVRVQPPWKLLRGAFRTANAAVSALGLELDLSEDDEAGWTAEYRKNGNHDTPA